MNIEQMTAKVRPRKSWEAIDLGVALVQQHAVELYKVWFMITLPIFFIITILLADFSFLNYLLFWLLKPLWERPLLHFLSRQLFNEQLTAVDCVKQFFKLAKIQWFASLTWRRLSFTRSLDLPIIQLEGLSGKQRSQRLKVIHSIGSGSAAWLTLFFVTLENIFYFSLFALVYLLLPSQMSDSINWFYWFVLQEENQWLAIGFNLSMYFSISLVAPFYTACGFALYLNQRTHLEAWDIELSFKRLAKKLGKLSQLSEVRLASWVCIIGFFSFTIFPQPIKAKENLSNISIDINKPKETIKLPKTFNHETTKLIIDQIKKTEQFNQKKESYRYQLRKSVEIKNLKKNNKTSPIWHIIGWFFSVMIKFFLWGLFILFIIYLIVRYRHILKGVKTTNKIKKQRPLQLFGLDLKTESLPDKPDKVALSLIDHGEFRQAVSLLYRASLIWYIENTSIVITESNTELECLYKIKTINDTQTIHFMSQLTSSWRQLAYAHQVPEIKILRDYCKQWSKCFALSFSSSEITNA